MISAAGGGGATAPPSPALPYECALERYDPVVGLETHVQLSTATKLFCGSSTDFSAPPNTHVCPVCLGLPGALPVVNQRAVEFTIRLGLALGCTIRDSSRFVRKHYFYPDLPKNYQITQFEEPLCVDGYLDVDSAGATHRVSIERIHLEEDTARLLHQDSQDGRLSGARHSLVDFNRAGIPLVEVVTRPIVGAGTNVAQLARAYLGELRAIVRALAVSEARMENGSLRCDVNVSLTPKRTGRLGTRTETKNLNSLRSVERAVRYEVARQGGLLSRGFSVDRETRHFDELTRTTRPGRRKEDNEDYRYLPEPDLVPIEVSPSRIAEIRASLPELPGAMRRRLIETSGLSAVDIDKLATAGVLDAALQTIEAGARPVRARNWWLHLVDAATAAGVKAAELPIEPGQVARISALERDGAITNDLARRLIDAVAAGEGDPDAVIARHGWRVRRNDELAVVVDAVLAQQPALAGRVRGGKVEAIGALIGEVMKATDGLADARQARELLLARLDT